MYPEHEFCQLVIWSDICVGQFCNIVNLQFLQRYMLYQHNDVLLTWNFFIEGHGKSFFDQHFGHLFEVVCAYEVFFILTDNC